MESLPLGAVFAIIIGFLTLTAILDAPARVAATVAQAQSEAEGW